MSTEIKLYKNFLKVLPKTIKPERVENGCVTGMPDVYLRSANDKSFWIENKICSWEEKLKVRKSQVLWMKEHTQVYGGKSFMLIGERKEIMRNYFFIDMGAVNPEIYKVLIEKENTLVKLLSLNKMNNKKFFYGSYPNMKTLMLDLVELI